MKKVVFWVLAFSLTQSGTSQTDKNWTNITYSFSKYFAEEQQKHKISYLDAFYRSSRKYLTPENPHMKNLVISLSRKLTVDSAIARMTDSVLSFTIRNYLFAADTSSLSQKNTELLNYMSNFNCDCLKPAFANKLTDEAFLQAYAECIQKLELQSEFRRLTAVAFTGLSEQEAKRLGLLGDTHFFGHCAGMNDLIKSNFRNKTIRFIGDTVRSIQYEVCLKAMAAALAGKKTPESNLFLNYNQYASEIKKTIRAGQRNMKAVFLQETQYPGPVNELQIVFFSQADTGDKRKMSGIAYIKTKGLFQNTRIVSYRFTGSSALKNRAELESWLQTQ